jgi:hypothetical protein
MLNNTILASQSFSKASIHIFNFSSDQYFSSNTHSINGKLIISHAILINLLSLQVIVKKSSLSNFHKSQVL